MLGALLIPLQPIYPQDTYANPKNLLLNPAPGGETDTGTVNKPPGSTSLLPATSLLESKEPAPPGRTRLPCIAGWRLRYTGAGLAGPLGDVSRLLWRLYSGGLACCG